MKSYLLTLFLVMVAMFLAGCTGPRVCFQGYEAELHEVGEYVTPLTDAKRCADVRVVR